MLKVSSEHTPAAEAPPWAGTRGVLSLTDGPLELELASPPDRAALWSRIAADPQPVTISDWGSARMTHANDAAQRLLGRSQEQLQDVTGRQLLPTTCAPLVDVINHAMHARDAFFGPIPVATQQGPVVRWTEIHALGEDADRYCVHIFRTPPAVGVAKATARVGPVLVAEDNPMVLEVISSMLRPVELRLAADGREAIEHLLADPTIASVVTDLEMPRVSGAQLLDVVRALRPDLADKVIVLTGRADLASDLVGVTLLAKPVSADALRHEVERTLGRSNPTAV